VTLDGPPFASGNPHLGHFYNKVIKDVANRFKLMKGHRIHFVPGFDCYGSHIEEMAMKQPDVGRVSFKVEEEGEEEEDAALQVRRKCREFVKESVLCHI